jgi:glycosyltransferase involved in cell wall biosynthesis
VENTGIRAPRPRDLGRVLSRLRRASGAAPEPSHELSPGIEVLGPLVLPPTAKTFRRINAALFVSRATAALRARGLKPGPIVFAYLPTKTTLQFLDRLAPSVTIYDCVDNFFGLKDRPRDLAETERELLARSALVFATSPTIHERLRPLHPRVQLLHHGVAADFFLPPRSPGPHRRLAYFGTVRADLDFAALRALADAGYEVDLIGPVKKAPADLGAVRLRGSVPRSFLPDALARVDALLLPYVDDDFTRGIVPAKIYECLATGRPVLASPLPALKALPELSVLRFAGTPAEWTAAARSLDAEETEAARAARVAVARAHSEEAAFAELRAAIDGARPSA